VVAEVHSRRKATVAAAPDLFSEQHVSREEGARDRSDPHDSDEPDDGPDQQPQGIERELPHSLPGRRDAEAERDGHADRRQEVHRLRVEIVLVDDARQRRHAAEQRGDPGGPARMACPEPAGREPRDRDREQRYGIVEEDEGPSEPGSDSLLADVVELLGRQP